MYSMLLDNFLNLSSLVLNREKKHKKSHLLRDSVGNVSLQEFVSVNEREFEGKKYLYVPKAGSDSLIVSMSTHNYGERYYCLRHLLELCPCSLLFIKDPTNTYYLDKDGGELNSILLNSILKHYSPEKVSFFGSSMSGYSALRNSVLFNCNAIVCNPQVSYKDSYQYAWTELRKNFGKGKF